MLIEPHLASSAKPEELCEGPQTMGGGRALGRVFVSWAGAHSTGLAFQHVLAPAPAPVSLAPHWGFYTWDSCFPMHALAQMSPPLWCEGPPATAVWGRRCVSAARLHFPAATGWPLQLL